MVKIVKTPPCQGGDRGSETRCNRKSKRVAQLVEHRTHNPVGVGSIPTESTMYKYKKIKLKNGKTIDEHRYIMQQYLGRELQRNELVHHIDKNPRNNNIFNLQIITPSEHTKIHAKIKQSKEYGYCYICKQQKSRREMRKDKTRSFGLDGRCKHCFNLTRKSRAKYGGMV